MISCDLQRFRRTKSSEPIQERCTYVQLNNLRIKALCLDSLTQKFEAAHLGFYQATAMVATLMRESRLSECKQNRLLKLFVAGCTARTASALVGVNETTASYYFHRLRLLIHDSSQHLEMLDGNVEVDESYFAGVSKGKRGRGAADKSPVFGLLKRNGKGYIVIIPNAQSATFMPIIREKVKPDSIVYTDTFKSYYALDVSKFRHFNLCDLKEQLYILKQLVKKGMI